MTRKGTSEGRIDWPEIDDTYAGVLRWCVIKFGPVGKNLQFRKVPEKSQKILSNIFLKFKSPRMLGRRLRVPSFIIVDYAGFTLDWFCQMTSLL